MALRSSDNRGFAPGFWKGVRGRPTQLWVKSDLKEEKPRKDLWASGSKVGKVMGGGFEEKNLAWAWQGKKTRSLGARGKHATASSLERAAREKTFRNVGPKKVGHGCSRRDNDLGRDGKFGSQEYLESEQRLVAFCSHRGKMNLP